MHVRVLCERAGGADATSHETVSSIAADTAWFCRCSVTQLYGAFLGGRVAVAAEAHQPLVPGFEPAVDAFRRPDALQEQRLQMLAALTGLAVLGFPGRFVVPLGTARPMTPGARSMSVFS